MQIQSNFKDYYDVGMAWGMDEDRTYLRYPKVLELEHYPFPQFSEPRQWSVSTDATKKKFTVVATITIGFCGKLYSAVVLRKYDGVYETRTNNFKQDRAQNVFCYSANHVKAFVQRNYKRAEFDDFCEKTPNSMDSWKRKKTYLWDSRQRLEDFVAFFGDGKQKPVRHTEIMNENLKRQAEYHFQQAPIFVATPTDFLSLDQQIKLSPGRPRQFQATVTYNGCLKQFDFMRVMDANTAFQELRMYLGNQAEPRKPIPEISDEVMAEIKGFDKFSFRKPPKQ